MKKSRLLNFSGILLLVVGLFFVFIFGLKTYDLVQNCEHGTGAVPVQGCEIYLWSGSPLRLSGVSLAVIGSGLTNSLDNWEFKSCPAGIGAPIWVLGCMTDVPDCSGAWT